MSLLQRHRWFVAAAGITLAFAVVSLTAHKSSGFTAFADVGGFADHAVAAAVMLRQCHSQAQPRTQLLGADDARLLALGLQPGSLDATANRAPSADSRPLLLRHHSFLPRAAHDCGRRLASRSCEEGRKDSSQHAEFPDAARLVDLPLRLHRLSRTSTSC